MTVIQKALQRYVLLACLLLSLIPLTASAAQYDVSDYDELKTAIAAINAAGSGDHVISLGASITIDEPTDAFLALNQPVTVTILGNGHTISGTAKTGMFSVTKGATLILGDSDDAANTLVLDAQEKGQGIRVTDGTLIMYGGLITNCATAANGGGVYVSGEDSVFYMHGGSITNCYSKASGGGIYVNFAHLEMTDSTISGCKANNNAGGIFINRASAVISNAKITNNTTGTYVEKPGPYTGASKTAGGIYVCGDLTMTDSEITANTLYGWNGGGIRIDENWDESTVNITRCTISGNYCWKYGGGVCVYPLYTRRGSVPEQTKAYVTIKDCTITDNRALTAGGGLMNLGGNLTLVDTAIYGNTADAAGDDVYADIGGGTGDYKTISTTLCDVPSGLFLKEDNTSTPITDWFADGMYSLDPEGTIPLRWGDKIQDGYHCSYVRIGTEETQTENGITIVNPFKQQLLLKAAYPLKKVTFKVIGGKWADGTNDDVALRVPLTNISESTPDNPAGTLTGIPAVNQGGAWIVQPPETVTGTEPATYIYTYSAIQPVTFRVVNGTWADGSTADITVSIPLLDASGYPDADGSGDLSAYIPTGMEAKDGFHDRGSWNPALPADGKVSAATAGGNALVYTYTFEAKDVINKSVTFKVVNGTWADGSTADITVSIPLVDADGYPDANGTGRLDVPVGMIPNEGYDPIGHWDITPPTAVQGTDAAVYTYIFVEKPPVIILPETGDSNRLGLWMLTLALSAVGVALAANRTPARKRNG